jgi:hypothetical protein
MRTAGNGDFPVEVEGMGRFIFARKTMRDVYAIRGEYAAVTSNNFTEEGGFADIGALAFITLNRLMVSAPSDFDLAGLDPVTDDDAEPKIVKVFLALREKELSFRPQPKADGAAEG